MWWMNSGPASSAATSSPGEPFPIEAELGQEYGASRSVIREAVKSLAAKGLLESRTRTGIRVLPPVQLEPVRHRRARVALHSDAARTSSFASCSRSAT